VKREARGREGGREEGGKEGGKREGRNEKELSHLASLWCETDFRDSSPHTRLPLRGNRSRRSKLPHGNRAINRTSQICTTTGGGGGGGGKGHMTLDGPPQTPTHSRLGWDEVPCASHLLSGDE
jgi:hypothetical protein